MSDSTQHQFISHVTEDAEAVARLQSDLETLGLSPWVARSRMIGKGGQNWQDAIRRAIREGHAFIACFSSAAVERRRSYMNRELDVAIEELALRPRNRTWFVPIRFDDCEIPELRIGAHETLWDLHRIDLFPDWSDGVRNLAASLGYSANDLGTCVRDRMRLFEAESPDDQHTWIRVLEDTEHIGVAAVSVVRPHYDIAQRLWRYGALEHVGWRRSYELFRVTDRGRTLLAELRQRR